MEDPYQEQGDDKMGTVTTPPPMPLLGCSFSLLCCQFPGPPLPHPAPRYCGPLPHSSSLPLQQKEGSGTGEGFSAWAIQGYSGASQVAGCHLELLKRKSSLIDSINSESISFDIGDPEVAFILSVKDRVS